MRYLVVVVAACLLLAGCGLELLGAAAIRSGTEAEQIKAMDRQIHNAAGSMGKVNLQRAVDTYQAEKGVWPPSLDALVPGYVPSMPRQADGSPFGYDPATGRVSDGPAPAANADAANLAALRNAINRYGQDSGYYPPSLQALVPRYITSVPVSASGQPYAYNPQNGYLAAPGGAMPAAPMPGRGRGGMGMGGPMGEAATGMGVQRQLNGMGNAGANQAGGYARGAVGGMSQDHNARQHQVMDNLGL